MSSTSHWGAKMLRLVMMFLVLLSGAVKLQGQSTGTSGRVGATIVEAHSLSSLMADAGKAKRLSVQKITTPNMRLGPAMPHEWARKQARIINPLASFKWIVPDDLWERCKASWEQKNPGHRVEGGLFAFS